MPVPLALGQTRRPILIVPGLHDSGEGHWQRRWLEQLPTASKVEQANWERPTLAEWVLGLVEAIRQNPGAILVGHSLGCALIAHVTRLGGGRGIGGAMLVAPAELNGGGPAGPLLQGFGPMPLPPLPFPSVVVASRNDPYVPLERAEIFARSWGAVFVNLGLAGHVNIASGHGPWPEGLALLGDLLHRTEQAPQVSKTTAWRACASAGPG